MKFDNQRLRVPWWLLIWLLLIGWAIADGANVELG
jgi:cytochrome bd-type quinol oxidase subunit 2